MRKWIVGAVGVLALAACSSDREEPQAVAAPSTSVVYTPAPYDRKPASAPPKATTTVPPVTTTRPAPNLPAPAASAVAAGCEEPDPTMLSTIQGAVTEGRVLREIAAVSTTVDGLDYEYVAANVYDANGDRSVSAAVWLSPGVGVVNLSSNSRDVTPEFMFGRGIFGNAGDEAGLQVQDCVMALALGR